MATEKAEFGCILRFDTDDPQFTRGFALGMLWERIKHEPQADMLLRAESAEMVMRIAERSSCAFTAQDLGDGWMQVVLTKRQEAGL